MKKLKAGAILLSAEWFSDISYDTTADTSANISQIVESATKDAVGVLEKHFEVIHPYPIATKADVQTALKDFKAAQVDLFVVCSLIYSGDDTVIDILREMPGIPVLVWSYNRYKKLPNITQMNDYFSVTGAPGMLQFCAPLKRMGIPYGFVFGVPGDETLDKELADYVKVLEVKKRLQSLNILSVGRRYEPMSGAWIDELKLKLRLGPKMVWLSAYEYAQAVEQLDEKRVRDFVDSQVALYETEEITDEDLMAAAKASIAVYDLAKKYNCQVVSFQDMDEEVHTFIGCRPQMSYQPMFEEGISAGMEADIDNALCTWIAKELSEGPSMYAEILTYDEEENFLVVGHAAMHDLRLARSQQEIMLTPDLEFMFSDRYKGVWNSFVCKPGKVTLVSLFEDNDQYKFVVSTGESLDRPGCIRYNSQALVRVDAPIRKYMRSLMYTGVTQHFILCYGDIKERVALLAKELHADFVDIDKVAAQ